VATTATPQEARGYRQAVTSPRPYPTFTSLARATMADRAVRL